MPDKVFFNIVEMTKAFRNARMKREPGEAEWYIAAAALAQAQQLSVISGRLADIAGLLELISGKSGGKTP